MKTIKTKVYTLDELDKEAKEVARKWYIDGDDMLFLPEAMSEYLQDLLAQHGIECKDAKVFYSLSNCQGDGAMFEGVATWDKYTAKIKHSGHYYHYNSKTIDLTVTETGEEALGAENEIFNALYVDICKSLARYGYDWIDEENSDARVDENILANEYTFTKDGKRFG